MTRKTLKSLSLLLYAILLVSAGCGSKESEISGNGDPDIDWGIEVELDEMMAMAKEGRIDEIQWYVMPNVFRAKAADGGIYSLRNENEGFDLRNRLVEAGVEIGEGGVAFQHVF